MSQIWVSLIHTVCVWFILELSELRHFSRTGLGGVRERCDVMLASGILYLSFGTSPVGCSYFCLRLERNIFFNMIPRAQNKAFYTWHSHSKPIYECKLHLGKPISSSVTPAHRSSRHTGQRSSGIWTRTQQCRIAAGGHTEVSTAQATILEAAANTLHEKLQMYDLFNTTKGKGKEIQSA